MYSHVFNNLFPHSVLIIIQGFCGESELNKSICSFHILKLSRDCRFEFNKIKLSHLKISYLQISSTSNFCDEFEILYLGTKMCFNLNLINNRFRNTFNHSFYGNENQKMHLPIGINELNSNPNIFELQRYNYLNSDEQKDFFKFMLKFEDKIYSNMIKNKEILKLLQNYEFLPIINPMEIYSEETDSEETDFEETDFEETDTELDYLTSTDAIGYLYRIKLSFGKIYKQIKKNTKNKKTMFSSKTDQEFEDIYKSYQQKKNIKDEKIMLSPILKIDHKFKKIYVTLQIDENSVL